MQKPVGIFVPKATWQLSWSDGSKFVSALAMLTAAVWTSLQEAYDQALGQNACLEVGPSSTNHLLPLA